MKPTLLSCLVATVAFASLGCSSSNRLVGDRMHQASNWYGELGLTGHLNEVILRSGSRVTKLSIIGDANKIFVEHGVTLGKVEVWGGDNQISVPDDLVIRESRIGQRSVVIRRAPGEVPLGFEGLAGDSTPGLSREPLPRGAARDREMRPSRPMRAPGERQPPRSAPPPERQNDHSGDDMPGEDGAGAI